MSRAPLQPADVAGAPRRRGRRRRKLLAAASALVVLTAAVAVPVEVGNPLRVIAVRGIPNPLAAGGPTRAVAAATGSATALATVTRQDLASRTNVNGTLGYAGSYSVVNQATGTVTALPAVGQVIGQGQTLYSVSGSPVVLLYGSVPAYRALSEGATGADVQQLNADLVALGYATLWIDPTSDTFSSRTKVAVQNLQKDLGMTANGTLALGQAVFLPGALRITSADAKLGATAQPGGSILSASSTTRVITVALDAAQQSAVKVGDAVTITLPDHRTTPGVVSAVGSVATKPSNGSGNSTITVEVAPSDTAATGTLDQAPVQVSITTGSVKNALAVPVSALLARASGGYAVEVVDAGGAHHLTPVELGLFDDADGLVQVTGSRLQAGQRVVVPSA